LYSGSNVTASSINGYILTSNNVGYYLAPTSIVEYYGTSTSVVTGVPNGIAITANQQYGILEINLTGTPGSTWVYPETTNEIYIRTSLILTAGEFNLDSDHVTSGGGRSINVESGASITRVSGFIRSETEDGSGVVKWNINTNSTYVIPFGYDAANYIPFTFQQTSGNAGVVQLGTYRTIANNTPYPPTVTHVRDGNGIDNSPSTVDRFWNITVPGTTSANLTFSYVASEGSGIVSPRAQRWEPVTAGWYPPAGVQSNPTSNTTLATGITAFNTWWTLSALGSPLPIELASFNVNKSGTSAIISWVTASEINNDFFNVEKSADGLHFESISKIQGAGTSSTPLHYTINDSNPFNGINYYRLKQTDYDGHFTYSDIKTISFTKNGSFTVYPNPSNVNTAITIEFPEIGAYEIKIADAAGKIIYTTTAQAGDDMQFHLNPADFQLKGGMYLLSLIGENSSYNQKLLLEN